MGSPDRTHGKGVRYTSQAFRDRASGGVHLRGVSRLGHFGPVARRFSRWLFDSLRNRGRAGRVRFLGDSVVGESARSTDVHERPRADRHGSAFIHDHCLCDGRRCERGYVAARRGLFGRRTAAGDFRGDRCRFSWRHFFSLLVLVTQGGEGLLPPDQPAHLYRLTEGQAAYYYVFNLLMLLLVGLMSSYLAERLQTTGGELKQAEQRAEHAERLAALGHLAAGLAHEIRNPLSSISGSVQLLRSGAEKEEDRDLCEIVLREAARLNDLVTDMVDLSKQRRPVKVPTNVGGILTDIVDLATASGRGASDVELIRSGVKEVWIDADPGMLRQLVWNLVRNALQATGSGGQVRVRLEEKPTVRLFVEDDGVGIDSAAMESLFDVFYTTRSKGTGLGLAVVKRVADEHEFDITVSSAPGEGATFAVDFGAARQAPQVA